MTAVQVYRDAPRCLAMSRAATSSRTMIQKLEIKTVALGMIKESAAGFLALLWPSFIITECRGFVVFRASKKSAFWQCLIGCFGVCGGI